MSLRLLSAARRCRLWLVAAGLPAVTWAQDRPPGTTAPPITTVAAAAARWANVESDDVPVRLVGVITGTSPSGAFRLHDGNLGIFAARSASGQNLKPGDRVAVNGVLRRGGFSPWITPLVIEPLGSSAFPEARRGDYSLLATGAADNQWLEIEGVVRAAKVLTPPDFIELDLGMAGGNLRVLVNHGARPDLESLVDATVRMRGVAAVNADLHGYVTEPSFRVPSLAEVSILRPAGPDAFAAARVPVARIMRHAGNDRVRTGGIVTRRISATEFFLREGNLGLKVETRHAIAFGPGDVVEAVGYPTMENGLAVLEQSVGRVLATGPLPTPTPVEPTALLSGTHNSDLVRVRARLVDWTASGDKITLVFQNGDHLFNGLLNHPAGRPLTLPATDSVVNVIGVCVINELEDTWRYQPRSFALWLADLADLELVQAPPWWTPARLWWALFLTCAVLLAAAGWVWALRRQIRRKRALIEQQARHAAALEERTRIARELHDTLEQGLTGLSLQMKAMETDFNATAHPAQARLQFARQILRQIRALARNAIRELRSEAVPAQPGDLMEELKRVAEAWNQSGALRVEVVAVGIPRPLPPRLAQHLLGIGTEAMTNAVKHGRAEAIQVEVDSRDHDITVRITDNGAGFEPEQHWDRGHGCFGLIGMRERAHELRGKLIIRSRPGAGAEVVVTVPTAPETAPLAP